MTVKLIDTEHGPNWFYEVGDGRAFIWNGGPYIDMIREDSEGSLSILEAIYSYTDINIGVWNYSTDKPSIDSDTPNDFREKVELYLRWES